MQRRTHMEPENPSMSSAETSAPAPVCVWYLDGVADDTDARRYVLSPFPFQVGRDHRCALWLPHKSISKQHAEFTLENGRLTLRDLGSTNGTFINAERLHEASTVEAGDLVHFANVGFRVAAWRQVERRDTVPLGPFQSALELEIKERRRAEEALWNAEAMWRALVDAALDGILLCDITGRIQSFNRAAERLFGYAASEVQGRNVSMLLPCENAEKNTDIDDLLKSTSAIAGGHDAVARRKDGTTFPIHMTASEVWLADRRMLAAIVRDVSDEKVAAESLRLAKRAAEQSSQAKSEFLANMSHEIRTPMSAILGYADLLLAEEGIDRAPPHRVEAFRTIQRNGEHLLQVINDILDLSKVEAGKFALELIRCSPGELLIDVQRIVKQPAEAKNLPFNIEFHGDMPETIETDPMRLRQVLVNLIGNAIKFTERGRVDLSVTCPERTDTTAVLHFTVTDTGIGIDSGALERLFKPFTQGDASMGRRYGGTGLGLAISVRLAQAMGGLLQVKSTLNQGTTFRLILPCKLPDAVTPGQREDSRFVTPSLRGRVLVVEDDAVNRQVLELFLKKMGVAPKFAIDGESAIKQTAAETFDVVLMDCQLPGIDGLETTRRIRRKLEGGRPLKIIALTANTGRNIRDSCLAAGMDDFLTKPVRLEYLVDVLKRNLPGG
jgi:PAS domain S-box-containing protein